MENFSKAFEKVFNTFGDFGQEELNYGSISLKNIDIWIAQAGLSEKLTSRDTAPIFPTIVRPNDVMNFENFKRFLIKLCQLKKVNLKEVANKLQSAGNPDLANEKVLKLYKKAFKAEPDGHMADVVKRAMATSMNHSTQVPGDVDSHKE